MRQFLNFRKIGIWTLGLVVIVFLALFAQVDNWRRDLTTNHAALDPNAEDPQLRPQLFTESTWAIASRIDEFASQHRRWTVASRQVTDSEAKIYLTRRTTIFRWTDDIAVHLTLVDGKVRLDATSKSRVGKGDLGQNPRNLRELIAGISPPPQP
jgi:hypothetical protein